mmetsp:Transcript_2775/g.5187  ORF Transcript_2775/g.5187 Transcript_2775/m.5187 type:complete len:123 (+) Transcript_2775:596-964(+)
MHPTRTQDVRLRQSHQDGAVLAEAAMRAQVSAHARVWSACLQAPLLRRQLRPVWRGMREEADVRDPQVHRSLPRRAVSALPAHSTGELRVRILSSGVSMWSRPLVQAAPLPPSVHAWSWLQA